MPHQLDAVRDEFDREDQQIKHEIAAYLFYRPGRWVAKPELVERFDIDESGISRHLDHLHDSGYVQSKTEVGGKRYVKWNGRGVGGLSYWIRAAIPDAFWEVGENLRDLLQPTRLGGAFVPTFAFVMLLCLGLIAAFATIILSYLPGDSLFGITIWDTLAWTGLFTVLASVLLALIPVAHVLETVFWWVSPHEKSDLSDDE